jgi:hypothetical protein
MKHFWSYFWKLFGIAVLVALGASVIVGVTTRSIDRALVIIQQTLIAALGICGAIGLLVPVMLYFEDKEDKKHKEDNCVVE